MMYCYLRRYELVQSGAAPVIRLPTHPPFVILIVTIVLKIIIIVLIIISSILLTILITFFKIIDPLSTITFRRGGQFSVSLSWRGRSFDQKSDRVKLVFETGLKSSYWSKEELFVHRLYAATST